MDSKAWDKVKDQELIEWLQSDAAEARELIVQAETPPRQITMKRHPGGRVQPDQAQAKDSGARKKAIDDLAKLLGASVNTPPVILKAAGAVVVEATNEQVLSFIDHHLVKAIYPNRPLRKTSREQS